MYHVSPDSATAAPGVGCGRVPGQVQPGCVCPSFWFPEWGPCQSEPGAQDREDAERRRGEACWGRGILQVQKAALCQVWPWGAPPVPGCGDCRILIGCNGRGGPLPLSWARSAPSLHSEIPAQPSSLCQVGGAASATEILPIPGCDSFISPSR